MNGIVGDSPTSAYARPRQSTDILLTEDQLTDILKWVDSMPLSRPKRNFTRDFSDACLTAEIVARVCPKIVELHNYPPANSASQKIYNWNTLSSKVLRKLGCALSDETIQQIVQCKPGIVETVLYDIRQKLQFQQSMYANTSHTILPQIKQAKIPVKDFCTIPSSQSVRSVGGMVGQQNRREIRPDSSTLINARLTQENSLHQSGIATSTGHDLDKESLIVTLRDTVDILQEKVGKLELLLALKDRKIQELSLSKKSRCI